MPKLDVEVPVMLHKNPEISGKAENLRSPEVIENLETNLFEKIFNEAINV